MFPVWLQAGFWGLVGGSALLLGAAVGYFVEHSPARDRDNYGFWRRCADFSAIL